MPLLVAMTALLMAACAADKPKPTPLETYPAKIAGRVVWEAQIGKVGFALVPAVKDGVFYLASGNGDVVAMQAETGTVVWRASAGAAHQLGICRID